MMVEVTTKDGTSDYSGYRVFGFRVDAKKLAEDLAKHALENNQWAEVLTMAAERLHDGDWRAGQMVETF